MHRRRLLAGLAAMPLMGATLTPEAARRQGDELEAVLSDPRLGRTDALLVIQDGETRLSIFDPDQPPGTRHVSWSVAKSVTHALVGAAVLHDGLDIDRPVSVLSGDHGVTLRHLLTLTDGLPWDEAREPVAVDSDASRLLFGPGRFDVARYAASRPGRRKPPGSAWNYSTGSYHLIAAELTGRLFPGLTTPVDRRRAMAGWMRRRLFEPAGMAGALFEFDPAGTFYAGSLMWADAQAFARLGRLYLDDGVIDGRRLLPEGWATFARTPTVEPTYGAGWWLEGRPGPGAGPSLLGGSPPDAFHARGLDGQVLMVVPARKLIIVRLGYTPDAATGWPAISGCLRRIITLAS